MLRRILISAAAAATVLAAAPARAAEDAGPASQPCSCCSDGSVHGVDHALHQTRSQKAPAARTGRPAASADPLLRNQTSDDPFVRNNAFGG